MTASFRESLASIAEHLVDQARSDDVLRGHLQALARGVLSALEEPERAGESAGSGSAINRAKRRSSGSGLVRFQRELPEPRRAEVTLDNSPSAPETISLPTPKPYVAAIPSPPPTDRVPQQAFECYEVEEFPTAAKRCAIKKEATEWMINRQRLIREGMSPASGEAMERAIRSRADEYSGGDLWMLSVRGPSELTLGAWSDLAGCYQTVTDALQLMIRVEEAGSEQFREEMGDAMNMLAEAQSALRAAVRRIDPDREDEDQNRIFRWLRRETRVRRHRIDRHMRMQDPADPSLWKPRRERITDAAARWEQVRQRSSLLEKLPLLQREARQLIAESRQGRPTNTRWERVCRLIDEQIGGGTPPSHVTLRDTLMSVLGCIPEQGFRPGSPGSSRGVQLVLREAERHFHQTEEETEDDDDPPRDLSEGAEVGDVREHLAGSTLVLIGGERRPAAEERLKEAFDLEEVDWIETREHQSSKPFESHINKPNVAVVGVMLKLASHSFSPAVRDYCSQYEKQFVRLRAGLNPNRVAVDIMQQVGDALATTVTPAASTLRIGTSTGDEADS